LTLYTHNSYYGLTGATTNQLFFGKAFEFFAQTVLFKTIENTDVLDLIVRLRADAPFHSIHSVALTKTFDDRGNAEEEELMVIAPTREVEQQHYSSETTGVDEPTEKEASISNAAIKSNAEPTDPVEPSEHEDVVTNPIRMAALVLTWERNNRIVLDLARTSGLAHLLSGVMNKTFSQLHQMRVGDVFQGDNLYIAARRFELVLQNALGSLLKNYGTVVQQNIAMTDNGKYLLTEAYKSRDRSYKLNVHDFLNGAREIGVADPEKINFNRELLRVLLDHPLFKLLKFYDHQDQKGWLPIGARTAQVATDNKGNESVVEALASTVSRKASAKDIKNRIKQSKSADELIGYAKTHVKYVLNLIRKEQFMEVLSINIHTMQKFMRNVVSSAKEKSLTPKQHKGHDNIIDWYNEAINNNNNNANS
jgi:hypothetical protein